jgi:hypothetical protein
VLIVVAIVAAGCLGATAVGSFAIYKTVGSAFEFVHNATDPARDATLLFVTDLTDGDHPRAYDRLCDSTRSRYSLADFTYEAEQFGRIVDHEFTQVSVERVDGESSATVAADLTLADGQPVNHTFPLVEEGGEWKVCGDPF